MDLEERVGTDGDEADKERQLVLRRVTISVTRSIEVGDIGECAFQQHRGESSDEEHHLVEFVRLPKTAEQGETGNGCA